MDHVRGRGARRRAGGRRGAPPRDHAGLCGLAHLHGIPLPFLRNFTGFMVGGEYGAKLVTAAGRLCTFDALEG